MINKLRQPKKYAHSSLNKQQPQSDSNPDANPNPSIATPKTKQITKPTHLKDKKKITKKNEPSALRLAAINETFHKIENNAEAMLGNFQVDHALLGEWIGYQRKVKCRCERNIRFYCLRCMGRNQELRFPVVELPFDVKVIHHSSQKINKSSIIPMALLSPQITLSTFTPTPNSNLPSLLKNLPANQTCILFPHRNSKKVNQINFQPIKNIVVLDCTWFQTDQLVACLQSEGYDNFVRLEDYQSLYWRYNHHSDRALSSGEALAYFLREYQMHIGGEKNKYDPIMFLYLLNLKIIEQSYRHQCADGEKEKEGGIEKIQENIQKQKLEQKIEENL